MDTAWDASGRWLPVIKPCMRYLDWFLPSVEEAELMAGTREPKVLSAFFRSMGVKNIVIKLGEAGCFVDGESEESFALPAYRVETVDTSGAGDAWCAGFIAGLVKKLPLREAAALGNGTGSLCVTGYGTTAGLKNYDQTRAFMAEIEGVRS